MAVIDNSLYPHIIDLIFYYADVESLAVMRHVDRAWRKEVLAKFYHLRGFAGARDANSGVQTFRFDWTNDRQQTTDGSLFRECRILDFGWGYSTPLDPPKLPRLDTIRIDDSLLGRGQWGDWRLFNDTRIVYENVFVGLHFKDMSKVQKIVINCRDSGFWMNVSRGKHGQPFQLPGGLESLTLIAHTHLDNTEYGLSLLYDMDTSIMFTDAELIFIGEFEADWFDMKEWSLQVMSFEEYKAEVGEKEFDIETNWNAVGAP